MKALSSNRHEQLMRRATWAAVAVAVLLIFVKVIAFAMTASVAILSSLVDSSLDCIASVVNFLAVRHSLIPPDRKHRYGHGKAEAIAGFVQAMLIIVSTVFLVSAAVNRLMNEQPIEYGMVGIIVMLISIASTAVLVRFQKYVVKETRSVAIAADSLHYVGDLLINSGVIVALLASVYLGWHSADPLFAMAVAALLINSSRKIMKDAVAQLMDEELPDAIRAQIRDIALGHAEVINVHELRTRLSGRRYFIQLHLEMDGSSSLNQAHQVAEEVEEKICAVFPDAEVLIHEDPEGLHAGEIRH